MTIRGRRITIPADTLTRLDTPTGSEGDNTAGSSLVVTNRSEVVCELGGSTLNSGEGYEFRPGESIPVATTQDSQGLYALSGVEMVLQVLEIGV